MWVFCNVCVFEDFVMCRSFVMCGCFVCEFALCGCFVMCVCEGFLMCGCFVMCVFLRVLYCFTLGFSLLFPQLQGKCQGKTCKDGARPALIPFVVICVVQPNCS